jgi:hypothetical protein
MGPWSHGAWNPGEGGIFGRQGSEQDRTVLRDSIGVPFFACALRTGAT